MEDDGSCATLRIVMNVQDVNFINPVQLVIKKFILMTAWNRLKQIETDKGWKEDAEKILINIPLKTITFFGIFSQINL